MMRLGLFVMILVSSLRADLSEIRSEPNLDFPNNRAVVCVGRRPDEDLLNLRRAAAQRIAQVGAQIMLQAVKNCDSNEHEGRAQEQRVPGAQPKG